MEVSCYQFCKKLAEDFGVELNQKYKTKITEFPVKNGKRKVKSFHDAIIVGTDGNEYPYMLNKTTRNEEKLNDFDYIYIIRSKSIEQVIKEANINLKSQKCRVCEGGGWYSTGIEYFYKDISCKV